GRLDPAVRHARVPLPGGGDPAAGAERAGGADPRAQRERLAGGVGAAVGRRGPLPAAVRPERVAATCASGTVAAAHACGALTPRRARPARRPGRRPPGRGGVPSPVPGGRRAAARAVPAAAALRP